MTDSPVMREVRCDCGHRADFFWEFSSYVKPVCGSCRTRLLWLSKDRDASVSLKDGLPRWAVQRIHLE